MSRFKISLISIVAMAAFLQAGTWQLTEQGQWIPADRTEQYASYIRSIEQLARQDEPAELVETLEQLRRDFPEMSEQIDSFLSAESRYIQSDARRAASRYEQFAQRLPRSDLFPAALERQFMIGKQFLHGRRRPMWRIFRVKAYDLGEEIMRRIADRTGTAPIARRALREIAESFERRQMYDQAYQTWSSIRMQWPFDDIAADALLAMARTRHAAYRGPGYDVSNLISARSFYVNFRTRYSDRARELEIDDIIEHIDEQLARRNYEIAAFYERSRRPEAAELYYRKVLDNWPETQAGQQAAQALSRREPERRPWSIFIVDIIEDWLL